jgi:hypothetical protein
MASPAAPRGSVRTSATSPGRSMPAHLYMAFAGPSRLYMRDYFRMRISCRAGTADKISALEVVRIAVTFFCSPIRSAPRVSRGTIASTSFPCISGCATREALAIHSRSIPECGFLTTRIPLPGVGCTDACNRPFSATNTRIPDFALMGVFPFASSGCLGTIPIPFLTFAK